MKIQFRSIAFAMAFALSSFMLLSGFTTSTTTFTTATLGQQSLDKVAEFPGGQEALDAYLKENTYRPRDARRYGTVMVEFTVEKNGRCDDFVVTKSLSETLDAAAVDVLSGMPKWTPATKDGKNIKSTVAVPVRFTK